MMRLDQTTWTTEYLCKQLVESGSIIGAEAARRLAFSAAPIPDGGEAERPIIAHARPVTIEYDGWQYTVERDASGHITLGRNNSNSRIDVAMDQIDKLIDALFAMKDEPQ